MYHLCLISSINHKCSLPLKKKPSKIEIYTVQLLVEYNRIYNQNFSHLEFFSERFKGKVQAAGRKTCKIIRIYNILQKWKNGNPSCILIQTDNSQFIFCNNKKIFLLTLIPFSIKKNLVSLSMQFDKHLSLLLLVLLHLRFLK